MQEVLKPDGSELRAALRNCRRLVVKIGSRVLIQATGRPDLPRLRALVKDIAAAKKAGRDVVLVTSGAIGTGMAALGLRKRPTDLPELQMAAAVGQSRLMALYDRLFAAQKCRVGQVLLTHGDLRDRQRHLNARNTMITLLRHGIVPIVNENDVVAVDEIRFGDNDLLAALVALLIQADLLVLLTTVDGFRMPDASGRMRRVPFLSRVDEDALSHAIGKGGEISTGGMASKLRAASMVAATGMPVVIANGRSSGIVGRILAGENVGTLIGGERGSTLSGRERWIAFFHRARGAVVVDAGAQRAIVEQGRSLLPIGIRAVEGDFRAGEVIDIRGPDGTVFARGVSSYNSEDLKKIQGKKTTEIPAILGSVAYEEAIHRDNMVILCKADRSEP